VSAREWTLAAAAVVGWVLVFRLLYLRGRDQALVASASRAQRAALEFLAEKTESLRRGRG